MYWNHLLILVAACALGCSVGFAHFIWFLSVGYGFGVACGGVAILVTSLVTGNFHWLLLLQCLVLVAYGLRLGLFLFIRETKNAAYKKVLDSRTGNDKKMPVFVSLFMWAFSAFLYAAEVSPVFFRMENQDYENILLPLIGVVISACGVLIEALADKQKSAQKAVDPNMVATKGLYKYVRCANYFGELTVWTGVLVGGLDTLKTVGQWIFSVVAYIMICYIMLDGAKRTEASQTKRYGTKEEYKEYFNKTPIIVPFLPLYHLNKFDENGMPVEKKKK